jgi:hypothetical protein
MICYLHFIMTYILYVRRNSNGPEPTAKIRLDMQKAMQTDAAVFRFVPYIYTLIGCYSYSLTELKQPWMRACRRCARSTSNSIRSVSRIEA